MRFTTLSSQRNFREFMKNINRINNIRKFAFLAIFSTTLGACNNPVAVPTSETLTGNWHVESIKDKHVIAKSTALLIFNQKNQLSGSASCNNISTSYNLQSHSIKIGPIATTRKMCLPALMQQESLLLQALSKVKRFKLHDGELSMYDHQGVLQIKATKTKP